MQTLNVGAGRSEADYKADIEQKRQELRAQVRTDADHFFWAAGLSALATGVLPIRFTLFIGIGCIDLLRFYGQSVGTLYPLMLYSAALLWIGALVGLGFAARRGYRWAFWIGLVMYAADMITLVMTFSLWAFGVHSYFVYRWFRGQKALKDLQDEAVAPPTVTETSSGASA